MGLGFKPDAAPGMDGLTRSVLRPMPDAQDAGSSRLGFVDDDVFADDPLPRVVDGPVA